MKSTPYGIRRTLGVLRPSGPRRAVEIYLYDACVVFVCKQTRTILRPADIGCQVTSYLKVVVMMKNVVRYAGGVHRSLVMYMGGGRRREINGLKRWRVCANHD